MIDHVQRYVLPAAFSLLPEQMRSTPAEALLLAIGLQESNFTDRRQRPNGQARGFWQFEELGGVKGVLQHPQSRQVIGDVLLRMKYGGAPRYRVWEALEHNDVLAAAFARLLVWTLPDALPSSPEESEAAWSQYLAAWRPGAHTYGDNSRRALLREKWEQNYAEGWRRARV